MSATTSTLATQIAAGVEERKLALTSAATPFSSTDPKSLFHRRQKHSGQTPESPRGLKGIVLDICLQYSSEKARVSLLKSVFHDLERCEMVLFVSGASALDSAIATTFFDKQSPTDLSLYVQTLQAWDIPMLLVPAKFAAKAMLAERAEHAETQQKLQF